MKAEKQKVYEVTELYSNDGDDEVITTLFSLKEDARAAYKKERQDIKLDLLSNGDEDDYIENETEESYVAYLDGG